MLLDLADVYLRVVDSFGVVFSLLGQVFKHRPWMVPLIPVALLVVYVGTKMRRSGPPPPPEQQLWAYQRLSGR
jgi:hypothetical protein